jgi:glycosyltransferase involved in cell wall biosynthesis
MKPPNIIKAFNKQNMVTILTVCLNSENTIEDSIKSVLAQTYRNLEYIIIDGGSKDGTLDLIQKYKHGIAKIISEKDEGIYDAMNKGIKYSSGEIIYFLNSDDRLLDKNVINDAVIEFEKNKNISLLYGNVISKNKTTSDQVIWKFKHINSRTLIHGSLCHQSVFAKRYLFNEVGLFNKKFVISGDYEWLLKVFYNKSYKTKYFDRFIAYYNTTGFHTQHQSLNVQERNKLIDHYCKKWEYSIGHFLYRIWRKINGVLGYNFE